MQQIKKYANRKLYHSNQKRYITLDGIAQLIRDGEQVHVLDNETGDDITAAILAQVVVQARPHTRDPLPVNVLTSLIQLGGDALAHMRRITFSALGGHNQVEAEINRRIDRLVSEGALTASEVTRLRALLLRHDLNTPELDLAINDAMIPRRTDIVRLQEQVDALTIAVEQLFRQQHMQDIS